MMSPCRACIYTTVLLLAVVPMMVRSQNQCSLECDSCQSILNALDQCDTESACRQAASECNPDGYVTVSCNATTRTSSCYIGAAPPPTFCDLVESIFGGNDCSCTNNDDGAAITCKASELGVTLSLSLDIEPCASPASVTAAADIDGLDFSKTVKIGDHGRDEIGSIDIATAYFTYAVSGSVGAFELDLGLEFELAGVDVKSVSLLKGTADFSSLCPSSSKFLFFPDTFDKKWENALLYGGNCVLILAAICSSVVKFLCCPKRKESDQMAGYMPMNGVGIN